MNGKMKKLPDAELDLMLIIWRAGKPVSRAYIDRQLQGKREWSAGTVLNLLSRLADRGFLTCEKQGKANLYTAAVAECDYLRFESAAFLDKLYGNSLRQFVAAMYENRAVSDAELDDLRGYLDALKGGGPGD